MSLLVRDGDREAGIFAQSGVRLIGLASKARLPENRKLSALKPHF